MSSTGEALQRRAHASRRVFWGVAGLAAMIGAVLWKTYAPPKAPEVSQEVEFFKECQACPEMALLPGGAFKMTTPVSSRQALLHWRSDKPPKSAVQLPAFAIGRYEVTVGEWRACAAEGFCKVIASKAHRRPVSGISFFDAKRGFIKWLNSKVEGAPYRLPTEAEWEYAAQGGAETPYPWGDKFHSSVARAKLASSSRARAVDVGSYPPNGFGLYDMSGNLYELTSNCYDVEDGHTPPPGRNCYRQAVRGGSYQHAPDWLRTDVRTALTPGSAWGFLGFRVVRDVTP